MNNLENIEKRIDIMLSLYDSQVKNNNQGALETLIAIENLLKELPNNEIKVESSQLQ